MKLFKNIKLNPIDSNNNNSKAKQPLKYVIQKIHLIFSLFCFNQKKVEFNLL